MSVAGRLCLHLLTKYIHEIYGLSFFEFTNTMQGSLWRSMVMMTGQLLQCPVKCNSGPVKLYHTTRK